MKARVFVVAFLAMFGFGTGTAAATATMQQPAPADRLKVYLDCQYECDFDFLRQNVAFVDWVRERTASDIHLLVTTQTTGGGGWNWTLKFIGVGPLQGTDETLTFSTASTDTADARRKELARIIRIGLARYVVGTGNLAHLDVTFRPPAAAPGAPAAPTRDPWDYWVFNTGLSGNVGGERSSKNRSFRVNFSANRVTEDWKISLSTNSNYNENTFEISETDTVRSITRNWGVNSLFVKSLTGHMSAGLRATFTGSTFSNHDYVLRVMPGIEFDVFPYAESTRRSWTFMYSAGAARYNYDAETIFGKLEETVPEHSISTDLGLRQPWGTAGASLSFSQHLNNLERNRLSLFGHAQVQLFKGFSFNVFGDYSRIRDQINLKKGNASAEEVLLRQRQLFTGYRYYVSFGISYRFGSIFNNVVNPRFGGGGGSFIIFG